MANKTEIADAGSLRKRAEQALRASAADMARMPLDDLQSLVHELQVHQVELSMQNEELCETQLQLQDSRDSYSELFEFAPVGYLTLDVDGVIRAANLTACALFEQERAALIGSRLGAHLAVADRGAVHQLCRGLGDRTRIRELRVLRHGQTLWTHVESRVHLRCPGLRLVTLTDIDARKRAESELQRACEMLEQKVAERTAELAASNQQLERQIKEREIAEEQLRKQESHLAHVARVSCMGEMVGGISHEINQPLHAISCFATACEFLLTQSDGKNGAEVLGMVRQIAEQAVRSGDILKRLRAFVRKSASERSAVDVNRVVGESVLLAASESRRHHVDVRLTLADGLAPVFADRVQIQQVLVNLLRNALESMAHLPPEERSVAIRTSSSEGGIEVAVQDEGLGVDPDVGDRIFDAFYSTKAEGMGLGLAISRSIVDAHGGRIWAAPRTERGTTFHFHLPLQGA